MKLALWFLLLLSLLVACDAAVVATPVPSPVPTPTPTPAELVRRTAVALQGLSSFHFVIDHTGTAAYVDPEGVLAFRGAAGDYMAPDRAQAVVTVSFPGLVTELSVISIGAVQWQTNPLTGKWEELPADWGFNPSVLFREEVGIPAVLETDMTNVASLGTETIPEGPDGSFLHLAGDVAGIRLSEMSGGLISPEPVHVDLWVNPDTFLPVRLLVEETAVGDAPPGTWQLDFSQFNQEIAIEPPQ